MIRDPPPATRHGIHRLPRILEAQFPGIVQELITAGAVPFYPGQEFRLFANQRWVAPFPSPIVCIDGYGFVP